MNTLQENPEFVATEKAFNAVQKKLCENRDRKAAVELELSKPIVQSSKESAFEIFQIGGFASDYGQDNRKELVEEYQFLEQQERFLNEAAEEGRRKLSTLCGQASLEICQAYRPAYVKQVQIILNALETICAANRELVAIRDKLQANGIETGSLPFAFYPCGLTTDDQYGNRATFYRRDAEQNFPELKKDS